MLNDFKTRTKISLYNSCKLLSGLKAGAAAKEFRYANFKVRNKPIAEKVGALMRAFIDNEVPGCRLNGFMWAVYGIVKANEPGFDSKRFKSRIIEKKDKMVVHIHPKDYIRQMKDIYNGGKTHGRVSFNSAEEEVRKFGKK